MLKCCRVVRAAWGANPADIKFQSISKREGDALLAAHRKKVEYKKPDEFAQKMALSVGAPDYPLNAGVSDGDLHTNPKTGEVGGYPGADPTRYGDWEKGGRCLDF